MRELTRRNFGKLSVPRARNPFVQGIGYVNDDVLFDSFSVAAGAAMPASTIMFSVPVGGAKTLAQTNMQVGGQLENGDTFKIAAFGISIAFNTHRTDAINLLDNVSVKLRVGGRVYTQGKLSLYPGGAGGCLQAAAQVGTAPAGDAPVHGFSNGVPDLRNMFTFRDPIEITQGERIAVEVVAETGFSMVAAPGVGTTITAVLYGERVRKVQ
ncbi:MAG: hypothetical protein ACE14L_04835 [Terriglobales bacterium]